MNIEASIRSYLRENGIPAEVFVPRPRPDMFVSIERTGGNLSNVVLDHPMIVIQSWAQSRYEASELAYRVDHLMGSISDNDPHICDCKRNSLYAFPDPESEQPRYQAVYDLVVND